MQLALIPPRRVPPEGKVLIELHQFTSVKNARPERVHIISSLCQGRARHKYIQQVRAVFNERLRGVW